MSLKHISDKVLNRYPLFSSTASYYRARRQKLFYDIFKPTTRSKILDVGGMSYFWGDEIKKLDITLLNIEDMTSGINNIKHVFYNGGKFPFADQSFDIVFSNSTIEHVGDFWDKKLFASEIQRVGKSYWVQTPNFYFFWEPHAQIPFFQFFPGNIQLLLHKMFKRSQYPIEELLSIRLITASELKLLFPNGTLIRERFLFLTKSFIIHQNNLQ